MIHLKKLVQWECIPFEFFKNRSLKSDFCRLTYISSKFTFKHVLDLFTTYQNKIIWNEWFLIECHETQITSVSHPQMTQTIQWVNQNLKEIHVASTKCRKISASESWLVLAILLIGRESGTSFLNQLPSIVMQNQNKHKLLSTLKWKFTLV